MITETQLIDMDTEAFSFDRSFVDQIAFPLGDRYPQELFERYFFHYGGLVKKFKPKRILEIGVRYAYTGAVFCLAARAGKGRANANVEYIGIDDESYHFGSCEKANQNLQTAVPWAKAQAIKHNSFNGIPQEFGTFDLAHIDGNHDDFGVLNDLKAVWPILNPGGIIVLDDYLMEGVARGIHQWLSLYQDSPEQLETQIVPSERGMFLIRKA